MLRKLITHLQRKIQENLFLPVCFQLGCSNIGDDYYIIQKLMVGTLWAWEDL